MEATRVTQEVIDGLKQKYAEAQRAAKYEEVVLTEAVQELLGKIRR